LALPKSTFVTSAFVVVLIGVCTPRYIVKAAEIQSEPESFADPDDQPPSLLLGARPEWALALRRFNFSGQAEDDPGALFFVFSPRFEISVGKFGDRSFILGTFVLGPAFISCTTCDGPPFMSLFLFDFGIKAGGCVQGKKVDVLIGPRISADLMLWPNSGGAPTPSVPFGTFGATIGFRPENKGSKVRFIAMVEPGFVVPSGFFSLGVTIGVTI